MPTLRQRKETLVDAFPKDFRLAYNLRGGEYTESFAEIRQTVADHFDRERESSSISSDGESSNNSKANRSSSNNSDSSSSGRKKKNRTTPKRTRTRNLSIPKNPGLKEECPIYGGHTLGDCRLNPRSESYDPPKPYFKNDVQRQNDNYQGQNSQNRNRHFQITATAINARARFRTLVSRVNATII